jgi:hypothetical protein
MDTRDDALLRIVLRLYEEIRGHEARLGLRVGPDDIREPIEYYQDAVRALLSFSDPERLTVQRLTADVRHLRERSQWLAGNPRGFDRPSAQVLADLYGRYTLLYSALFSEAADRDYRSQVSEKETTKQDLAAMMEMVKEVEGAHLHPEDIRAMLALVDNQQIEEWLESHNAATQSKSGFQQQLRQQMHQMDHGIEQLAATHLHYCTAQLHLYEQSKEVVKQLAAQGLNIAGRFVAQAAGQGAERGPVRGR